MSILANGSNGQFFHTQATNSLEMWVMEIFCPENSSGGRKMLSRRSALNPVLLVLQTSK